jgi:glutamate 5-kinase
MSHKDIRKKTLEKANRIVVKVGSSILASPEKAG